MYAKLSKEITSEAKIQVDNAFFTDFMPFAPENYVKVYLYGLSLAYLADETVNTIEEIAKRLNIDAAVVSEAFSYWANCGIVNVLSSSPRVRGISADKQKHSFAEEIFQNQIQGF